MRLTLPPSNVKNSPSILKPRLNNLPVDDYARREGLKAIKAASEK
jgi:hypothetical protein